MKILCVEDDERLAVRLRQMLVEQGYRVESATDGLTGWNLAEIEPYDPIPLDRVLPGLDGIEFCQRLRKPSGFPRHPNRDTPLLLMTAMNTVAEKIAGLNAGADDYLVKPFDPDELSARVRALLQRARETRPPVLCWGAIRLDSNARAVNYRETPIDLAAKEYEPLELFLRDPERIFSLDRLLDTLREGNEIPLEGTVRAHIKGLRGKLEDDRRTGIVGGSGARRGDLETV
jgi:DNA-binding response OmpR family regulator